VISGERKEGRRQDVTMRMDEKRRDVHDAAGKEGVRRRK
jgi:hypothetical protein